MSFLSDLMRRFGVGSNVLNGQSVIAAASSGNVYTITKRLGAGSSISLITGTDSNLTLSGLTIIATSVIDPEVVQIAVVKEMLGLVVFEYPVFITGIGSFVGLTLMDGVTPWTLMDDTTPFTLLGA